MNNKKSVSVGKVLIYIFLAIWAIMVIFPFYWMVLTSIKSYSSYNGEYVPQFFTLSPTLENYIAAFTQVPLAKYFLNTLIFTVVTTAVMLVVVILAAFAFARLEFRGKDLVFTLFLSLMMIPNELVIITNFQTITSLGMRNTFLGLILPSITSIFYIYLLKENFAEIPDDVIVASPELFSFYSANDQSVSGYSASVLTFTLKKEENRNMAELYDKIQKIVNTPSPYDRNKFVSVYYNEGEIDGVMGPLQNAQRSAVFFEKLFRTVLPFVVYALELIAVLGLANECGVRRLLGDGAGAVFFGIWLPAAFFVLLSYLIPSLAVLAAGLGPYASWTTAALHAAASLVLTAAVTGLFCLLNPLNLLKERNDEQ